MPGKVPSGAEAEAEGETDEKEQITGIRSRIGVKVEPKGKRLVRWKALSLAMEVAFVC